MQIVKTFTSILVTLLTVVSVGSSAGLIINGSFEDNDIPHGSWRWFNSNQVNGWQGSNIEIWHHLGGEMAFDGNQFAELNAHPTPHSAFSIYQDIKTVAGQVYDLSFAYQARRHKANEMFLAEILAIDFIGERSVISLILDDHTAKHWTTRSVSFSAISNLSRLKFTAVSPSVFTQGNLLDDIRITSRVAEPPSFIVFCIGLCCLIFNRNTVN